MSKIVKIMRGEEWRSFEQAGELAAGVHDADGFIHLSTIEQLPRTANKWFAGETNLMAVVVDGESLGKALRWEPNPHGELFPHLYGVLSTGDVVTAVPLVPDDAGNFDLPEALAQHAS